jgi:uncharacterized membrane protein
MYRYVVHPSGWLIALTVLDVFVILLTWAEWQRVKRSSGERNILEAHRHRLV